MCLYLGRNKNESNIEIIQKPTRSSYLMQTIYHGHANQHTQHESNTVLARNCEKYVFHE